MKQIILFLGCCLLGWGTSNLYAQQNIVASGGQATGAGGTVSYSIGQMDYISVTGAGGSITQGVQQVDSKHTLSGVVTYDNQWGTGLSYISVLLKQGNTVTDETSTNGSGYYVFSNMEPGNYTLDGLCTKPWGGVDAADALLINKHYVGMSTLTGLRRSAADVNGNGYINAADALITLKRFVGLQFSFIPGDWLFEHHEIIFTGNDNLTDNFKGLCYGDVNGSHQPNGVKQEPTLSLENNGIQMLDDLQLIEVPVRAKTAMNSAALSLIFNFPSDNLEILGVQAAYDNQTLVYNTIGNELRIGWYTLQPRMLNQDDVVLTITMKLKSNTAASDLGFVLDPQSNVSDFNGNNMLNKTLTMPVLVDSKKGFSLSQNIPNPFSNLTQINYVLPEDGYVKLEVLDIVGRQIAVLSDGQEVAGSHYYTLSGNSLPNGVYFYRMIVNTATQQYSQTKRMILSR